MLHLLYILAFTILAFLAVGNLFRSLLTVGMESQRIQPFRGGNYNASSSRFQAVPHPELLDDYGNVVNEPLLVMRSLSVQDAREQLDALYKSSPGNNDEAREDV
ncbi:DUF2973 domain-containing protein [Kamptonema animale CS-326]|jgi:predicted glycosyltransferase|uniref:DUF2973 domain-containing protein n=1 Tax=Kamptonema animale TaxID=92934 RepID=UPI00232CF783|nr:DUF2973 domain-containing protein [Kamptonema animale]MDB9510205.1 DUF2973 domain-containing protein [Kamptonema animale CS-326]